MRLLSIALATFSYPILGHAATIAGDWRGSVNLSGRPGRFVLHIAGPANALTARERAALNAYYASKRRVP